jgi:hypothetical protein
MELHEKRRTVKSCISLASFSIMAVVAGALLAGPANAQAPAPIPPDQLPTPRDAEGHPVLGGLWTGAAPARKPAPGQLINARAAIVNAAEAIDFTARGGTFFGYEEDNRLIRRNDMNRPIYKPEYWDAVVENDYWGNWRDHVNYCLPFGLPRIGAPSQIHELDGPAIALTYVKTFYTFTTLRLVPTDGRPHNPRQVAQETWTGDAVGHWEGDTLVIESIGFTDASWLGPDGWIHGFDLKVTERLTRKGNTLRWEATVEDPEYLQEPWVMTPQTVYLNTNPQAFLPEALPCDSRIHEAWGTEANPLGGRVH